MIRSFRIVVLLALLLQLFVPSAGNCLENCCECQASAGCRHCELQQTNNSDALSPEIKSTTIGEATLAVNRLPLLAPEYDLSQPVTAIINNHYACDKQGHPALGPPQI
jgi:hypothetical protein